LQLNADEEDDNTLTVIQRANDRAEIDSIDQVTVPNSKQFESVPRYMKGTLDFDAFLRICSFINKAAERKRLVLGAPSDRLGPNARASLAVWKSQTTEEVNRLMFVTDDDVLVEMESQEKKFNSADVVAAFQCLRFLKVVRVSEHQNVNRYVFLK
jgi:hypothetical protein